MEASAGKASQDARVTPYLLYLCQAKRKHRSQQGFHSCLVIHRSSVAVAAADHTGYAQEFA